MQKQTFLAWIKIFVINRSLIMIQFEVETMARHNNAALARKRIAPHDRRIQACLAWLQGHGIRAQLDGGKLIIEQGEKEI